MKTHIKIILDEAVINNFRSKIKNTESHLCWEWAGRKDGEGYGRICVQRKSLVAHRVSWVIYHGDILNNLCVCHKCDNPGCVNPAHLFLGTMGENNKDRDNKGRGKTPMKKGSIHKIRGEKCSHSKLTEKEVLEILSKYEKYVYTYKMLAKEYHVGVNAIGKIIHGISWKCVHSQEEA